MCFHTIVLTSDGRAVAFRFEQFGQCTVPEMPEGVRYVGCTAGRENTVLLSSDGRAVAFGRLVGAWGRLVGAPRPAVLPEGVRYAT